MRCFYRVIFFIFVILLGSSCTEKSEEPTLQIPPPKPRAPVDYTTTFAPESAYKTGKHRNLFVEMGIATQAQVSEKIKHDYQQLFFGNKEEEALLYPHPLEDNMAYIYTPDTNDIRSVGMSYGMMIAVMMNDKTTFDKLWRFAKTYMQANSGDLSGYFAWQLQSTPPFSTIDPNPAPDAEEYFSMALLFAHNRWGSSAGVLNYKQEANQILHNLIHKKTTTVNPIFNRAYLQVTFSPIGNSAAYTDPSYHLPAFYELWALWAEKDNSLWHDIASNSRAFFPSAAHPLTGLFPEYTTFRGQPQKTDFNKNSHLSASDAFRVIQNMAMDYNWFSQNTSLKTQIEKLLAFYERQGNPDKVRDYVSIYTPDGEPQVKYKSSGLVAMNAVGALASTQPFAKGFVRELWDQPPPTGKHRYYDGMLHLLGLLHTAGEFKIYGNPNLLVAP